MTEAARKRLLALVVAATNLALWVVPSNVVELVARNRHVILGRYSREHFTWILIVSAASVAALYLGLGSAALRKKRAFQVAALLIIGLPLLFGLDLALTLTDPDSRPAYVVDGLAYHRLPESRKVALHEDRPPAHRSYPGAASKPGFGRIEYTLTADRRGYRNQAPADRYDIVVLGDSFAEGSQVSDHQTWPVLLGGRTGRAVYNLGMSGYDPQHYLAALRKHGPDLQPKLVICLLYEGNDFRAAKWVEHPEDYRLPLGQKVQYYIRHSRLLGTIDTFMADVLGAVNADADLPGGQIVSWLPLRVAGGAEPSYYAFTAKRLARHYVTDEEFRNEEDFHTTTRILGQIRKTCIGLGAELLVVYAPDKPHVTLPLAADHLPAEQVRAFAALKLDRLPEPRDFLQALLDRLPAKENATRRFCQAEAIPFVSTTAALRDAAGRGRQVYFSYDQHWTPLGHEVVARVIDDVLQGPLAAVLADTSGNDTDSPTVRPASATLPPGG